MSPGGFRSKKPGQRNTGVNSYASCAKWKVVFPSSGILNPTELQEARVTTANGLLTVEIPVLTPIFVHLK